MLMSAPFYSLTSRSNYLAYPGSSINVPLPLHSPVHQLRVSVRPFEGSEHPLLYSTFPPSTVLPSIRVEPSLRGYSTSDVHHATYRRKCNVCNRNEKSSKNKICIIERQPLSDCFTNFVSYMKWKIS